MTTPSERYAAAKARGKHPVTTDFLLTFDFEFDPFQIAACHAVEQGKGVLVAAPTGAGKTVVGEFAAYFALRAGKSVFIQPQSKLFPIRSIQNLFLNLAKIELGY
jgi:ATP-dependent RNA helicase HelY